MDLLDRIYPVARDLLDRVDAALISGGAPADHPIWAPLRRLGALPGEVSAQFAAATPGPLLTAGDSLRSQADGYESAQASVPMPAAWRGPAAEAFAGNWSTISGYLAGDPASMAGRLVSTAGYLDDVVAWLTRGRQAMAGTLAECLGSAEAASLRAVPAGGPDPGWLSPLGTPRSAVRAAADLGAHLLSTAGEVLDDGERTLDAWAGMLDELPYPAMAPVVTPAGGHLELG